MARRQRKRRPVVITCEQSSDRFEVRVTTDRRRKPRAVGSFADPSAASERMLAELYRIEQETGEKP